MSYTLCDECGAVNSGRTDNPELCRRCGAILPSKPEERRHHSPDYRDRVSDLAQSYVIAHNHDYDAAYEDCREDYMVAELMEDPGARMWEDAATLLRRRADTVKGLRNA